MSDFNSQNNRAVWFDIPVADLDRAAAFYSAVLAINIQKENYGEGSFCILEHADGNGGCLIEAKEMISANGGILVYMNADKRIRDAIAQAEKHGGQILEPLHPIGPHGFRAILRDCEGNRIALHSTTND